MKTWKLALIFFSLLGTGNPAAQSESQQAMPPATPSQMQTASIYVTAATKKGVLIRDIKPDDITITENEVPKKIEKVACDRPEPLLVGILVDISGSRRKDSRLSAHYDALETFLHTLLAGDDKTYVVAYDDKVHKVSELLADRAGISTAFDKLRKVVPAGATALYDAVEAAAGANFKSRSGRRVLVVVGDWEDNASHIRLEEAVKAAQRTGTTIYAIVDADIGLESKLAHKHAVNTAKEATEQTGGVVYDAQEKNDFDKALHAIAEAVVGSCRVAYTTSENADAKEGVKLHVQASSKEVSILYPRVRFNPSP